MRLILIIIFIECCMQINETSGTTQQSQLLQDSGNSTETKDTSQVNCRYRNFLDEVSLSVKCNFWLFLLFPSFINLLESREVVLIDY